MLHLRLSGTLLTIWAGYAQAVEDCWALTKECRADLSCAQLLKCATDICAVPAKDLGFNRFNSTCYQQCACGLEDKGFMAAWVPYALCLTRTHNITDPFFTAFQDGPNPYVCPAIKESELVREGLDAFEGTWYLTQGTSPIDDLSCTQMEVTRFNDTHWLGSEYQEAQVGRLGMRWSQFGYLLTPRAPGVFDLRMMQPTLDSMSVGHSKNNVIGFRKDRWLIIQYCWVTYLTDIQAPTFGWWSYVIYSRTPEAPQDAVDRFNEILATHPATDTRTNKTVPIPVRYGTQKLCRYRQSAAADQNMTTCGAVDIMGGRRALRGGARGDDSVVLGSMMV